MTTRSPGSRWRGTTRTTAPAHAVSELYLLYLELPDDRKDAVVARKMAEGLQPLVEVGEDADRATVQHAIEMGERLVESVPDLDGHSSLWAKP